jgi:hypothetical protein
MMRSADARGGADRPANNQRLPPQYRGERRQPLISQEIVRELVCRRVPRSAVAFGVSDELEAHAPDVDHQRAQRVDKSMGRLFEQPQRQQACDCFSLLGDCVNDAALPNLVPDRSRRRVGVEDTEREHRGAAHAVALDARTVVDTPPRCSAGSGAFSV